MERLSERIDTILHRTELKSSQLQAHSLTHPGDPLKALPNKNEHWFLRPRYPIEGGQHTACKDLVWGGIKTTNVFAGCGNDLKTEFVPID